MSNITDEQRREVAARLRHKAADGTNNQLRTLKQILGLGGDKSYRDVFCRLADLIDRPTCRMDLTETMSTDHGEVRVWECSLCGGTHEEMGGRYERCPRCGAEVAR